jgi:hypothetical protein
MSVSDGASVYSDPIIREADDGRWTMDDALGLPIVYRPTSLHLAQVSGLVLGERFDLKTQVLHILFSIALHLLWLIID